MNYDTYGSTAVELAIDLANAALDDPAGVADFLAGHDEWFTDGTTLELSPAEATAVARTSTLVREVALADSEPVVKERLNALLDLAAPHPYATDHDGELHLHYARPDAGVVEQLTTTVAMGLSQVVVQHGWRRLGVCSAEGCDDVYVDTSRNASRRYCSNTCASRSTVAAYRARQRT
ncbi:CGNR zinc finger domain-containing protein [Modestobacter roseus]|uniref:Putative RNA-binding Zn ribbon-like protein n=1 Tax=Modestobacter roseus TaxID=1181884 RepID=A0A562IWQ7_9ACTN|nr:CGNR zinc finger domain-containing protein [Modestobacter roseus]MQA34034.1 CGNR zinc finger domain-containing protein [Modestobacter roseus]TWH75397.1 putative RNA-binding Zn ribbon-like protein [Modestobacter roseus]